MLYIPQPSYTCFPQLTPSIGISRPIAGVSQYPSNHGDVVWLYKETTSGVISIYKAYNEGECAWQIWHSLRSMRSNVHGGGKKADWWQANGQPMLPTEGTSTPCTDNSFATPMSVWVKLYAYPPMMTCQIWSGNRQSYLTLFLYMVGTNIMFPCEVCSSRTLPAVWA